MDKLFHTTVYYGCNYLSTRGLISIHISKRGSWMLNSLRHNLGYSTQWKQPGFIAASATVLPQLLWLSLFRCGCKPTLARLLWLFVVSFMMCVRACVFTRMLVFYDENITYKQVTISLNQHYCWNNKDQTLVGSWTLFTILSSIPNFHLTGACTRYFV